MPHLSSMTWDCNDRLESTASQIVNDGPPPPPTTATTAAASESRKVTTSQRQAIVSERFYLGGYEIYRESTPPGRSRSSATPCMSPTSPRASA